MRKGTSILIAEVLALASAGPALAYSLCEDPAPTSSVPVTIVCNAELATVSDDSAVVTWVTNRDAPSDVDCWGVDGSACNAAVPAGASADGIHHYVELSGLRPGRIYYYRIETDGMPALPTLQSPGIFRALDTTCFGQELFRFASLNDMHVGEEVSGRATTAPVVGDVPPSFTHDPPYWQFMDAGSVSEINQRGVAFTIVKGDLTSEGGNCGPDRDGAQYAAAKTILDGLAKPFIAIRGNHDKSLGLFRQLLFDPTPAAFPESAGLELTATNPSPAPAIEASCVDPANIPGDPHLDFSFDYAPPGGRIFHFVALDTWDNNAPAAPPFPLQPPQAVGGGRLTSDQLTWLKGDLEAHKGQSTFVFMHHPSSELAAVTAVYPIIFTLREPDAAMFAMTLAQYPNVVGVLSGHTHRNWITMSELALGIPFVETAASKEYPGGYAIYKVFERGYVQAFYKCATADCLAWSEGTRGEYLNLYPLYTSQTGARNGSFAYDFATRTITTPDVE